LELLFKYNADIHAQKNRPVSDACKGGYLQIVCFLLKHLDADAIRKDFEPLSFAVEFGNTEVVKLLLDYYITLDEYVWQDLFTLATENGKLDVIKLLVQKIGHCYESMLTTASQFGHKEVVQWLIPQTALCAPYDYDEAICQATKNSHTPVVELLIEKQANPQARNNEPICIACQEGHIQLVEFLLGQGADINAQNNRPIQEAIQNGHSEIYQLLQQRLIK